MQLSHAVHRSAVSGHHWLLHELAVQLRHVHVRERSRVVCVRARLHGTVLRSANRLLRLVAVQERRRVHPPTQRIRVRLSDRLHGARLQHSHESVLEHGVSQRRHLHSHTWHLRFHVNGSNTHLHLYIYTHLHLYFYFYRCQCLPGYTGHYCQQLMDNCASFPCKNNGVCINQPNSYFCNCLAGFTGSE